MSVKDFLAIFQSGEYYAPTDFNIDSKFCQQMQLNDDTDTTEIVTKAQLTDLVNDATKWRVTRIRSITTSGFSLDTKVILKPSVPFKMSFNGEAFEVTNITVYHPCPVTIQDKQPDALISLNDPAIGNPKYVVLVPITSGDSFSPSARFFSKIAPQIATVASYNPATGLFLSTDVPTGQGWSLSSLFPVKPNAEYKATPVTPGYFIWEGMPPLERYKEREDTVDWFGIKFPSFVHYAWRQVPGSTTPKYIMLETPVPVAASDLATLTRYIPITPVDSALHGIFGNVIHKSCAATPTTGVIERFEVGATCNPFLKNAINDTNNFDTDKVVTIVFGILLGLAALIGAYLALTAVSKSWDVEYAEFSKNAGKVAGVWAKNIQGKVSGLTSKASGLSSMAKNPTAALGNAAGLGDMPKNPMAALGDMPKNPMAALGDMPKVPTIAAPRLKRK